MDFISILSIFVLACFVGYYVVWSVTPALHTPLMAVTNAISSVIIVGALIAAAEATSPVAKYLGLAGIVMASINIFGGFAVTERMLAKTFNELHRQRVPLEQILLKPNMVLSGKDCPQQAGAREVAEATLRCFRRTVPAAVPGVVFLSGGQSDELATAHLNEMNAIGNVPWELSFSYGRALQAPALKAWGGRSEQRAAAQGALLHRARCNGAARSASYSAELEQAA